MKTLLSLLVHAALATVMTVAAVADPAGQLRELDRLLKNGQISQSEYNRRWNEVVSEGTHSSSVPRLTLVRPEPQRLRNEFSVSGGGGMIEFGDSSELLYGASALVGRFLTPNLQLSLGADYGRADVDDSSFSVLGALGALDVHFNPTATFVPYVGIGVAWTQVEIDDDTESDWRWDAHVGLKQYLNRDTAIKYQVGYFDHQDLDINGVSASIGVCFLF